jgi:[ribosomal protein S5]-alanine N-acetyltransferase
MKQVLETTRLQLRPCQQDDLQRIYLIWINSSVRRFLFDDRVISLDEARSFVESSSGDFERHQYGIWLGFVRDTDQLVGFAGLLHSEEAPNLIYGVVPEYWGQGYATEAAIAIIDYALKHLCLPKVSANVDEANAVSVRILQRLGMKQIGREIVHNSPLLYFERSASEEVI